jgi:hypothetical protein
MSTSKATAHLEVREVPLGSGVRREARLRVDGQADHICWHYDIFGGETDGVTVLDGYIHSVLFYALKLGLPLRVHGDLTDTALYNLDEFIRAWAQWRPRTYKYFEIIPDKVVSIRRMPIRRAISTFSGGVDANFTLVRNKTRVGQGGHDIKSVLMIHGFDVNYDNDTEFRQLVDRVQPTLDEFGVDLKIIKTSSKLLNQDWEDSFGAQLSGCLHQFSGAYDTALIGSSEPYTALVYPLGSTPITDRLFSGGLMNMVHDGAQFTRTAKVEFLVNFPSVVNRLKVCWEGTVQHENCGVCEKCIRTRLNFVAVGKNDPGCFPDAFHPSYIGKLRARNAFQIGELRTLLAYAKEKGISDPWVDMLSQRLSVLGYRRRLIGLLERVGLKGPIHQALDLYDSFVGSRPVPPRLPARAPAAGLLSGGVAFGPTPNVALGLSWPVSTTPSAGEVGAPADRSAKQA